MILEYFIPGFIYIIVFNFFTSRRSPENLLVGSVVISYVLKAIGSVLHGRILSTIIIEWNTSVIILSSAALILSLVSVILSENKLINRILLKINHKSIHNDIWHDVLDYKNGTTLRVVCDNAIYTGILVCHEEKETDSWFVLKEYIIEENGELINLEGDEANPKLAVNLKDVKRIELYYGDHIETKIELLVGKVKVLITKFSQTIKRYLND